MKLFVTGAFGFLGSRFVTRALTEENEIIALRHSSQQLCRITLERELNWKVKPISQLSEKGFDSVDVVVHLAAKMPSLPMATYDDFFFANVLQPLRLLRIAANLGVKKFVVAGSYFEYGLTCNLFDHIPTNAVLSPVGAYAVSKAAATIAMQSLAIELAVGMQTFRIFQVFGDGEPATRLWPSLKAAALSGRDFRVNNPEYVRDFIPVHDVVSRLLGSCKTVAADLEPAIHNLGTGRPQTLTEFSNHWWTLWNAKGRLIHGEGKSDSNTIYRAVADMSPRAGLTRIKS